MSIKIQFKNKVHALPKDIVTIQQIRNNVKQRYPNNFMFGINLTVINSDNIKYVTSDQELESLKSQFSSLRIRAIQISQQKYKSEYRKYQKSKQKQVTQSKIEQYQQKIQSKLKQPQQSNQYQYFGQKNQKIKGQKKQNLEKYQFCKNQMHIDQDRDKQFNQQQYKQNNILSNQNKHDCKNTCVICSPGQYKIDKNNPLLGFIDEILTKKLNGFFQNLKKQKQQNQSKQKKQILQKIYTYSFVQQPVLKIRSSLNSKYIWNIFIKNDCGYDWPTPTILYRINKNKTEPIIIIKELKNQQSIQISLSFIAQQENIIELFEFRFGYIKTNQKNQITFFGPKLNYYLDTQTQLYKSSMISKQKILRNKVEKVCRSIKRLNECKVIYEKLKELKIEDQISIDLLTDIITDIF